MEPSDTKRKLREMFRNAKRSGMSDELDDIKSHEDAEKVLGEPLLQIGDPDMPQEKAAEMMSYLVCKSMADATCLKCHKQYPGPWPLLGKEKPVDGWKAFRDSHQGDSHVLLVCEDCLPDNGKVATWLKVIGKTDDEKDNQKSVSCSIANLHMDDVDLDVRNQMIKDIKDQTGADKVSLVFSLDCAENTSHYQAAIYYKKAGERAVRECRCIGCGDISPDPLPTNGKVGPYGKRHKFAMMHIAGAGGLVPICHNCAFGDGMFSLDNNKSIPKTDRSGHFFGTVNVSKGLYMQHKKPKTDDDEDDCEPEEDQVS